MTITLETAERLDRQRQDRPRDEGHPRQRRHLPGAGQQPGRGELLVLQLRLAAQEHDQLLPGPRRRSGPSQLLGRRPEPQLPRRLGLRRLRRRRRRTASAKPSRARPKLSEPEAKNAIWLVETYRNIKFIMSVHSNGGQLFWQPGAYIADGRITTPRPPLGHEAFYWQSANRILSQVRAHRQTVVTPENVGGSSDVLYSSAGNVREDMYLNYGDLRLRLGGRRLGLQPGHRQLPGRLVPAAVGGGRPDLAATTRRWSTPTGSWRCSGSRRTSARTRRRRRRRWSPPAQSDSPNGVRFETREPATIYYTTDGTRADDPVEALQGDRVPRAGRDPVGGGGRRRSSGSRSTPRATSRPTRTQRSTSARAGPPAARCRRRCR